MIALSGIEIEPMTAPFSSSELGNTVTDVSTISYLYHDQCS